MIAQHVFCSTLVAFVMGGSRTPAAFKMEFFVTKVNGLKLLLLLHTYKEFYLLCGRGSRSVCEKHRSVTIETVSFFSSVS